MTGPARQDGAKSHLCSYSLRSIETHHHSPFQNGSYFHLQETSYDNLELNP
ncbi:hypothetical protein Hanom_Chr11g01006841 [Helianthus anomalus]